MWSGPLIGQLALQLSRQLCGARPTVAIDPIAARRELACSCGATFGLDLGRRRRRSTGEYDRTTDLDVVFEATGSPRRSAPPGVLPSAGRLILLGSTRGLVDGFDPYSDVHRKGITVIGAHVSSHPEQPTHQNRWTTANNQRLALDLMADGSPRSSR